MTGEDGRPGAQRKNEVAAAVQVFLTAIEARDWDVFVACFDPGATIFLPLGDSDDERTVAWREAMPAFRSLFMPGTRSAPPPLAINLPEQMPQIEILGSSAFVSFSSRGLRTSGRRAIVMTREGERWLVRHLHTARLPVDLSLAGV